MLCRGDWRVLKSTRGRRFLRRLEIVFVNSSFVLPLFRRWKVALFSRVKVQSIFPFFFRKYSREKAKTLLRACERRNIGESLVVFVYWKLLENNEEYYLRFFVRWQSDSLSRRDYNYDNVRYNIKYCKEGRTRCLIFRSIRIVYDFSFSDKVIRIDKIFDFFYILPNITYPRIYGSPS